MRIMLIKINNNFNIQPVYFRSHNSLEKMSCWIAKQIPYSLFLHFPLGPCRGWGTCSRHCNPRSPSVSHISEIMSGWVNWAELFLALDQNRIRPLEKIAISIQNGSNLWKNSFRNSKHELQQFLLFYICLWKSLKIKCGAVSCKPKKNNKKTPVPDQ